MITESLLKEIDKGIDGKLWGYTMGLPKLENIIDGVSKSTYTLLFANSGVGKSNFMLYAYIYKPLMEHLDDGKYKITLFALEMKAEIIMAKLLCTYIYLNFGIELSFKELLSKKRNYILSKENRDIVEKCIPWMHKVEEHLTIYDKGLTAESMYAILIKELKSRGHFEETETRKIYIPDDPDIIHSVIIDHAGLIKQNNGRSKKQEIDLVSSYLVTLRNSCGISPLMIMQSNRDQASSARRQQGFFLPQTSDVKETNVPVEDAEIILAVYNPNVDKRATHEGYDIKQLGNNFRSIVCLKNRYGESNVQDCCAFYGKSNIWEELPAPDYIHDYSQYTDKKCKVDNSNENLNFVM